ncbi:glycerophosphodiester phosphodiesterase family protein [Psychroserpens sp. Hel_I_66]|uniref:glycerophosphodiester phosphodiesterase family protein n=1 Tax=Psychroserpens sp. Hel_I_66 TaxID=1250004 RepID=UPI000646E47F|nr:glycerophosphodiester phosphodiesterase family protein [Psychroserpens sp. Hel_I_66]
MRYLFILALISMCSCTKEKSMDIQGHRGFRGLYPENSLLAFEKALALDIQTLELDVVISKDKKVVVSHEPFMSHEIALDPFGNEIAPQLETSYNLYAMPYDSIKLYDCGSKEHPRFPFQKKEKVYKPLLTEVIDLAEGKSGSTIFYNIEIKSKPEYDGIYSPQLQEYVKLVIDIITAKSIKDRTILQSFDVRALEEIKVQNPDIKTALLVDENESIDQKLQKLSFSPDIISPYFKLLDKKSVSRYQENAFKIIPWTVNEVGDINLMMDFEVDGIISDFPDRVLQLKH